MPFNKEVSSLNNDIQLTGKDMIIQYAQELLSNAILTYEKTYHVYIDQNTLLNKINTLFIEKVEEIKNENDFKQYEKAFIACMEFLKKHKKIVLSRYIEFKNGNLIKAFIHALSLYPYAHCYLFMNKDKECFCAASPETLASYNGKDFYTTSLAGSMKASSFENIHNAVWSIKNQKNNKLSQIILLTY